MSFESTKNVHDQPDSHSIQSIPVIGILGGIGSGKSTIAQRIAEKSPLFLIDGDQTGHDVLKLPEIKESVRKRFKNDVFDSKGEIDRIALGKLVFSSTAKSLNALADLEAIVHPEMRTQFLEQIAQAKAAGTYKAVLLDAAVLLESAWDILCDATVFVDTPRKMRLQRVKKQRNWTEEELTKREACQIPISDKRKIADYVIPNSGTLDEAEKQLKDILDKILIGTL